jgi:hypothetical protein
MGSFAVLPLPDLVELLGRRRLTGTLSCERGTVRKSVHLRDGAAVGAASNDPREFLGQLLINFGHIDEEQLAKAFQTQEETRVRLGKVLTMVGLVAPERVKEALAIKIRETLLDVFLWDSGVFVFDDGPIPVVDELDAEVALADVVREAEFRATAWSAFRGEFPTGNAALEVDEAKVPPGAGPDTVDGKLLALAREGKTVDEIGLALHATDFHLYQRLYALARQGVLRAAAPPRAATATPDEPVAAADLAARARDLLAGGRVEDAERLAAKAVELAPASQPARDALAEAERVLLERLRRELAPASAPRSRLGRPELARARLAAADRWLLSRCDGRRTVQDLARTAPQGELEVLKALRRFTGSDLVAFE